MPFECRNVLTTIGEPGHYGHILGNDHREAVEAIEFALSGRSGNDLDFDLVAVLIDHFVVGRHAKQSRIRLRAVDVPQTYRGFPNVERVSSSHRLNLN